ncbi:MAG: DUF2919 family protein [Gammaproteobacteria bacterium]|nr:DUF2919 family protein [Gammaproteobacteria bacterium]
MYKQRRWETEHGSIELTTDAKAKRTQHIAALVAQAYGHWRRGDEPGAEALCLDILKADVANAGALHILGVIANRRGHHRDASAYLRRAIQSDPKLVDAHIGLGEALRALQQFVGATAAFNRAIELEPHNGRALSNLTQLQQLVGRFSSKFDYDRYGPEDYSSDNSLKFSGASILIIAYLSRHFIYPIIAVASGMFLRRSNLDMTAPVVLLSDSTLVLASIPAVLVFVLSALCKHSSPAWMRWSWHHGRVLLLSAAITDAALLIRLAKAEFDGPLTIYLVLDTCIVLYILLSRRLQDTFASFPTRAPLAS